MTDQRHTTGETERTDAERPQLVLSLFPGIGLLDMAFESEGFCVVRGPDVLWGGDIRRFHPPAGRFDGVIGGPPCQAFSVLRHLNKHAGKQGNLIPEYERCVAEARPQWFLMENVPQAPRPTVEGYETSCVFLENGQCGGEQIRTRALTFGYLGRKVTLPIEVDIFAPSVRSHSVLAGHSPVGRTTHKTQISLAEAARLQGLPEDFLSESPFTTHGKRKCIGNGVPLPMGRAIAKAVREAIR
jgi:DNA (cytosine-5)-methyltransferase 1